MSPVRWMADLRRDFPYALRSLRRAPGFTALAVITLALGIGANAAIFSIVNAVLLRPLAFPEADRLVRIYESYRDKPGWHGSVSVPNYLDWSDQSRTFEGFIAYTGTGRSLSAGSEVQRVSAVAASANMFSLLGRPALLGRGFAAGEDADGANHVVVLSEAFWHRQYAGDSSIVGKTITLDGVQHAVLGVMPATFNFPAGGVAPPDIWLPFTPSPGDRTRRGSHFLSVVGRLAPGATFEQSQTELKQIAARIEEAYPDEQAQRTVDLVPLQESVVGRVRPALMVLLGAVALLLLIACANVANLLLARAAARRKDVAVRLALGASRGQLVRQFLTESTLLAFAGAILGMAAGWYGLRALVQLAPGILPVGTAVPIDLRVLGYLVAVSIVSSVLFGLAPALQASSSRLRDELAASGARTTAGTAQQRARNGLVVAQIALSLVLLVGAGLLMRAFVALRDTPSGIDTDGLITARLAIPSGRYGTSDAEKADRLYDPIVARLSAVPGVRGVGFTSLLPIESWGTNGSYWIDGRPRPEQGKERNVELRVASSGYFPTMGIALRAGRSLNKDDARLMPEPVLVNEAFVHLEFPNENPIGRRIRRGEDSTDLYQIVGVVADVRQGGLELAPMPELYHIDRGNGGWLEMSTMVVRLATVNERTIAEIRRALAEVAPDIPLYSIRTMDEVIGRSLASRRLNLWLLGIFAGVALVLAASGLYGVLAYTVSQRTQEMGIRMALGADGGRIVGMMLRQGVGLAVIGIVVGALGALAATRVLSAMLFGVGARDPVTFVGVALLLGTVAVLASWLPARRASKVDPVVALRAE